MQRWRDRNRRIIDIPDAELYQPIYSPWLGNGEFGELRDRVSERSLVSSDRLWVLYRLAQQVLHIEGDFVECGVYKGGTAFMFADILSHSSNSAKRRLRLFDTFGGMPETDTDVDKHDPGDFSDTSLSDVRDFVGTHDFIDWHKGFIPDSFKEVEWQSIAFLHIDLDIKKSILDTLDQLYQKITPGGIIVFDDYGFHSCYGARVAVDSFFEDKPEIPLCLPTGQAIVIRQAPGHGRL